MGRSDNFFYPEIKGYEVSCLFLVFVGITLTWEVILGLLTFINNVLRGKRASWLDRVKEEVLALGVVSLVLLFLEPVLERVCEVNGDDPNELDALDLLDLSSIPGADFKCPPGFRNVFPASIIHAAHYLLFYLAVVHIIFNMITNSITSRKFAYMVSMERFARNAEVDWEQEQMAAHQRGEEPEQVLLAEVDSDDDDYVGPGKAKKPKKPGFGPYLWRRVKRTWHLLANSVDQRSFSILRKVCQLRFEAHAMDNNVRSFSYINIASQVLEADLEQVFAHAWLMILFMTGLMLYPKLLFQVVWANFLCLVVLAVMSVKMSYILRDTVEVCRLALKKGCEKQRHLRREEVLMKMAGMMSDSGAAPYVRAATFMPTEKSFKSKSSGTEGLDNGQTQQRGSKDLSSQKPDVLKPSAQQAAAERQQSISRVNQWQADDSQPQAQDWSIVSAPDSPKSSKSRKPPSRQGTQDGYSSSGQQSGAVTPRPPYLFKDAALPRAVSLRKTASMQRASMVAKQQAEQDGISADSFTAMMGALGGAQQDSNAVPGRESRSTRNTVRQPESPTREVAKPGSSSGGPRKTDSNNGATRQSGLNGDVLGQPALNGSMLGQTALNGSMLGQTALNGSMLGQTALNGGMLGQPALNSIAQQMAMQASFNPWLLNAQLMAMAGNGSLNMMGMGMHPNMMALAAAGSAHGSPGTSGGGAQNRQGFQQGPPNPPAAPHPPQPAPPPLSGRPGAASLPPGLDLSKLAHLGDEALIQRAMANLGWGAGAAAPSSIQQAAWQNNQLYGTTPSQPGTETMHDQGAKEHVGTMAPIKTAPPVIEDAVPAPSTAEIFQEDDWWQALEMLQTELEAIQQLLAAEPDSLEHQQRLLHLQTQLEQLTQQLSAIDMHEPEDAPQQLAQDTTATDMQSGHEDAMHIQSHPQQAMVAMQEMTPEAAYAQLQQQQLQLLQYLQAYPQGLTPDQVQFLLMGGMSGRLPGPGPVPASLPAWGASLMVEEVRHSLQKNQSLQLSNSLKRQEDKRTRSARHMSPVASEASQTRMPNTVRLASKTFNLTEPEARAQAVLEAKRALERVRRKTKRQHLEMHEPHLPFKTQAQLAEEVEKKVKQLFWFRHPHVLLWLVNIIFLITSLSITSAVAFVIPYNKFQKLAGLGHSTEIWAPVILADILMATYMCWYVLPLYALITTAGTSFPPRVIEEVRAAKTMSPEDHHGISGMFLAFLDHIFVGVEHNERRASLDLATYFVAALADHAGIVLSPQLRSSASKGALEIMANAGVRNVLREFAQFWHDVAWYGPPENDYLLQADTSFMRTAFAQLDADGSGALSFGELAQMVRALGALATAGDIETMLWEVDLDGSRSVGFDEFTKFLVYAFFDVDTNGYIGLDELEESMKKLGMAPESPEICSQLMSAADHNNDGRINMREFFMLFEKLQVDEEEEEEEGEEGDEKGSAGSASRSR